MDRETGALKETRTVFGRRLRDMRQLNGLTQKQLGVKAGLDPKTASARMAQYERGTHTPSFTTAEKLADALMVPAAYFYARDNDLAEIIVLASRLRTRAWRQLLERTRTSL